MELSRRNTSSSLANLAVFAILATHVAVLWIGYGQTRASNIVQLTAVLLVVYVCLSRSRRTSDAYFRSIWRQLGIGFAIYSLAQCCFIVGLFENRQVLDQPSPADFFWMMFAFPILLVTVRRRTGSGWQWVDWLDAAQACTFFFLLYVLVFSRPAEMSLPLAYDLQSVGLVLAWAIRFNGTQDPTERGFFRNLGIFLIMYGILSCLGDRWQQFGFPVHGWVGLCWSVPLLSFCAVVLRTSVEEVHQACRPEPRKVNLPRHLQGISALGLSVMSIAVAATLAFHRSRAGIAALSIGFLLFAIRTCLREAQLQVAHGTLEHAVLHDPLTGLANRTQLMLKLERQLSGNPNVASTALLFIDLDRFKLINDSLGHDVGDKLLVEVASILCSVSRPADMVVRLAGDEFVMLLGLVNAEAAGEMAEKLVHRFRQPIAVDDRALRVSVSIGYVMGQPGNSADDLLRDADCAMYAAKRQGKDRAQSFHGAIMDQTERDRRLEVDLRRALANNELTVHYQPIYSLAGCGIEGFEALARWPRPNQEPASPERFIPIAEETGLIVELGKDVLQQACQQVQRWNDLYGQNFTVNVNVSERQFASPQLLRDIKKILTKTGLPPALLKLETTEAVLLSRTEAVVRALRAAREFGIRISLDDFLTGYSSLSYLLEYPCDSVKIDVSFVHAMDKDPRRAELVRTVVQLAKKLKIDVIAEGVETEEERALLEEMHCDLMQGSLLSPPLSSSEVETLLAGSKDVANKTHRKDRGAPYAAIAAQYRGKLSSSHRVLPL